MKKALIGIGLFFAFMLAMLGLGMSLSKCAGTQKVDESQIETAIGATCLALNLSGCTQDAAVQAAFPGITPATCAARVGVLVDLVRGSIKIDSVDSAILTAASFDFSVVDISKLEGLQNAQCGELKKAIGLLK
jgi:hypothetical protein